MGINLLGLINVCLARRPPHLKDKREIGEKTSRTSTSCPILPPTQDMTAIFSLITRAGGLVSRANDASPLSDLWRTTQGEINGRGRHSEAKMSNVLGRGMACSCSSLGLPGD